MNEDTRKPGNDKNVDEENLFSEEMSGVTRLKKDHVVREDGSKKPSMAQLARRQSAQQKNEDDNHLGDLFIPPVAPLDILNYHKPGIQHGVLRKLRLGQYELDARLDLHRHKVEDARIAVFEFIKDCLHYDTRTAIIVHGKGEKSQPQKALLKSCVNHWLRQLPDVLAFHSAQKHHGGAGALYVLIRKSDKQKLKAREQMRR